jgi:hypothetical protein
VELVKDDADQVVDLKLVEQPHRVTNDQPLELVTDDQALEVLQPVGVEDDSIPIAPHPDKSLIDGT